MAESNNKAKPEGAWTPGINIDEQDLINRVLTDQTDAKAGRTEWLRLRKRSQDDYFARRKEQDVPYKKYSDITIPVTSIAIEGLKSHIISVLMPDTPTVAIKATKQSGIETAQKATEFMWWQLPNKLDIKAKLYDIVHDTCIDGTKFVMVMWDVKKRSWYDPDTKQLVEYEEENPIIDVPDLEDIFAPVNSVDLQEAPFVIRRLRMHPDTIKSRQEQGMYLDTSDVVEDLKDLAPTEEQSEVTLQKREVVGIEEIAGLDDDPEVLEWYGRYDLNGDGLEEECYVLVLKQAGKLLRVKYLNEVCPSNRRPFVKPFKLVPISGVLYGLGLPFFIKHLQEQIDMIYNLRNSAGMLANIPFGAYRPSSGLPVEEIEIEPGIMIPLDDPKNDLVFHQIPFNPTWGMAEEQNLNQYIEKLTGINDLTLGQQPSRVGATRTYGGLQSLLAKSAQRLSTMVMGFQESFKDMFRHIYELNAAMLPEGYAYRVVGEGGEDIFNEVKSNSELRQTKETGTFDFITTATPENTNTNLQRELAQMLYQILMPNPLVNRNPKAMYKVTEHLIKKFGILDVDSILPRLPDDMMRIELTPDKENEMMMQGQHISPLPNENHTRHVLSHRGFTEEMERAGFLTETVLEIFHNHIREHEVALSTLQNQKPTNIPNVRNESIGSTLASQGVPNQDSLESDYSGGELEPSQQGQDSLQQLLGIGGAGA